ncbi:MAG TPA: phage major capsid protein [Bellilinea sp.]|nr:phage major capsid protein [Bellilinea sp.]
MKKTIRELRQERAALLDQAQGLVDKADEAGRDLTAEERSQVNDLMQQAENMLTDIEQREKLAGLRGELRDSNSQAGLDAGIGMSNREMSQYSMVRLLDALVSQRLNEPNPFRSAGLELEASMAVAKKLGREPRGLFVPYDVMTFGSEQRAVEKGGTGSGAQLVATEKLTGSFIDMLRSKMMTRQAGATILGGLEGDISIPKQTGTGTAYWIAEGGTITGSNLTVGQVPLTPKTVGGYTDITRKMLKQSSLDVEMLVRNDLAQVLSLALDLAGLHGPGTGNQPTGVTATSGIGSVVGGDNGAAPTWAHVVQLETEVSVDNADIGSLAYMTNPKVRGKLKGTTKSGTTPPFVWESGSNPLNGYPAYVTNQVKSNTEKGTSGATLSAIIFGNWADLVYGLWGALDVLADPYSGATAGTVRIIEMQDADVTVRRAESFAAMLDAITA